ncbi:SpaH/EbpB family LPXTG-anchored major pilin [Enterococcus gilvus]|uniref:SpaH/EbpB family LPXTG-anchored major pilin n=1 Tax=Enterococcus gilvus TaxID=160453 RepID=UPI003D6C16AA
MKKLTKLIAAVLMVSSIVLGGFNAFAAPDAPIAPAQGDLTIHKYLLTDDAAGPAGTGDASDANTVPDSAIKLQGVEFTVYKVGDPVEPTPNAPKVIPGGEGWTYVLNEDDMEVTAKKGAESYVYAIGTGIEKTTAVDGTAKWEDLDKGQYLVVESDISGAKNPAGEEVTIEVKTPNFVVAVPMSIKNDSDDITGWNDDVHVFPKNEAIEAVKEVEQTNDVSIGDILDFKITATVPEKIDEYIKFNISDTLDEALDLVADSVKVYGAKGMPLEETELINPGTPNEYYTIEPIDSGDPVDPTRGFKVVFTKNGMKHLAENNYKKVIVKFQAKINEKAVFDSETDEHGNVIPNKGRLEYTNEDDVSDGKDTNETETPVGQIELEKVDKDGNAIKTDTAKFKISNTEENARAERFIKVKKDAGGNVIEVAYPNKNGNGTYDKSDLTGFVDYEVETDVADGKARFVGLKVPIDYWLVETKAPDGYNLLGDPFNVKFDTDEAEKNAKYVLEKDVVNSNGFKLPETGGMGVIALVVAGIVLIGLAIMLVLPKKRHS